MLIYINMSTLVYSSFRQEKIATKMREVEKGRDKCCFENQSLVFASLDFGILEMRKEEELGGPA